MKDGISHQEAKADEFSCLQQAQQAVSAAAVNAYGGASHRGYRTNNRLYDTCMMAKGYELRRLESMLRDGFEQPPGGASSITPDPQSCWDSYRHLEDRGADDWYLAAIREQWEAEEAKPAR